MGKNPDAVDKLSRLLDRIDALESKTPYCDEFNRWYGETENLIEEIFDKETGYLKDFNAIYFNPLFFSCCTNEATLTDAYVGGLDEARSLLNFLIGELE